MNIYRKICVVFSVFEFQQQINQINLGNEIFNK